MIHPNPCEEFKEIEVKSIQEPREMFFAAERLGRHKDVADLARRLAGEAGHGVVTEDIYGTAWNRVYNSGDGAVVIEFPVSPAPTGVLVVAA